MKITRIGLAVHELGRAREILGVLVKYGFSEWVSGSELGRHLVSRKRYARISRHTQWERIRMAVEELGPTFIKFGQILADRPDIVPLELREQLKKLQDEAIPMSDAEAVKAIETELGRPVGEMFREFGPAHLASASVAQTYRARLLDGTEVCIKIQRPGISRKIGLDLHLMNYFAVRIQRHNPEMEAINLTGLVKEFGKTINRELDFRNEAANIARFSHCFRDDPDIRVPAVFPRFTTRKLLVEEYIRGTRIGDIDELIRQGYRPEVLARKATRLVFDQIFRHGFFHADPHPGNLFVTNGEVITFIDFGMMGALRPEYIRFLGQYVTGYLERDPKAMTEALLTASGKRSFGNQAELEFRIGEMLNHYRYLSVEEMDFGTVLNESVDILVHYGLRIPGDIYLLAKSLMAVERVAVSLWPGIDFAHEMRPYAMELLARQFDPKQISRELFESINAYFRLVKELPSDLNEIIHKLREGKFRSTIEVKGLDPLSEQFDVSSTRMSIAMVLAALIIGASIISQWQETRWIGVIVFCIAGVLGFWLLVKLLRRNKL